MFFFVTLAEHPDIFKSVMDLTRNSDLLAVSLVCHLFFDYVMERNKGARMPQVGLCSVQRSKWARSLPLWPSSILVEESSLRVLHDVAVLGDTELFLYLHAWCKVSGSYEITRELARCGNIRLLDYISRQNFVSRAQFKIYKITDFKWVYETFVDPAVEFQYYDMLEWIVRYFDASSFSFDFDFEFATNYVLYNAAMKEDFKSLEWLEFVGLAKTFGNCLTSWDVHGLKYPVVKWLAKKGVGHLVFYEIAFHNNDIDILWDLTSCTNSDPCGYISNYYKLWTKIAPQLDEFYDWIVDNWPKPKTMFLSKPYASVTLDRHSFFMDDPEQRCESLGSINQSLS